MKLATRLVEKPWGRYGVPHDNRPDTGRKIGEILFDEPPASELQVMVKYLYTSERLSIQVHPNDEQAQADGHPCGKDEMWIVLDAEADATIGLGLKHEVTDDELRQAILSGAIEELVDWRPVQAGDVIYNKAGTIHAAGAGLTLLEIQQSVDLTYRLYDYGRPRELHLDEGLAVARAIPHGGELDCALPDNGSAILIDGPHFGAAWCDGNIPREAVRAAGPLQLAVIEGEAVVGDTVIRGGECGIARQLESISMDDDCKAVLCWPSRRVAPVAIARAA